MTYTVTPSRPGDEPGLRRLWQRVFGDTDAFLDDFFRMLYRPGLAAVARTEGGDIAAAAYALPFSNALYLYAVATHPEHRHQGLGARVTLAAAGGRPAYLYPAEPSLRGWYARKMGAVITSYRPVLSAPEKRTALSPEEYAARREALLQGTPHVVYPLSVLQFFALRGQLYAIPGGGICAMDGEEVKELLPCPDGGEPFVMGLNGAKSLYWGLVLD